METRTLPAAGRTVSSGRTSRVDPRLATLKERGWDDTLAERLVKHAPDSLMEYVLSPGVRAHTYYRGVGVPLAGFDPKFPSGIWATPEKSWPMWFAFGKGPELGVLMKMQLPTLRDVHQPQNNMVRHSLRDELPDDRFFIQKFGFLKNPPFDPNVAHTSRDVKWLSYEDAVAQGRIRDLGARRSRSRDADAFC